MIDRVLPKPPFAQSSFFRSPRDLSIWTLALILVFVMMMTEDRGRQAESEDHVHARMFLVPETYPCPSDCSTARQQHCSTAALQH